jgi:decaprenyl-phosphate phosphoribosyltransferase
MKHIIKLIRPHQYLKNSFILLPLFFSAQITHYDLLFKVSIAFIAFSLSASSIYIFNDYCDIEDDRKHPKKKLRPLASGNVSIKVAIFLMIALFAAGLSIMYFLDLTAFVLLLSYIFINILYTIWIKHIPLLDIFIVSIGFVIRVFVGSFVINNEPSSWIIIMTFLLALFLALAKRRDDFLMYLENGEKMRKNIDGYNLELINASMVVMASTILVSYMMYTLSPNALLSTHPKYLYLTFIFVVLGILRYMQITFVEKKSGSPTEVLIKDRFIQLTILGFILSFGVIIYIA